MKLAVFLFWSCHITCVFSQPASRIDRAHDSQIKFYTVWLKPAVSVKNETFERAHGHNRAEAHIKQIKQTIQDLKNGPNPHPAADKLGFLYEALHGEGFHNGYNVALPIEVAENLKVRKDIKQIFEKAFS